MADTVDAVAELGYDYRGIYSHCGYATEAALAVRDFGLNILDFKQWISLIRIGNDASRRVAERVGMDLNSESERYGYRYWKDATTSSSHENLI